MIESSLNLCVETKKSAVQVHCKNTVLLQDLQEIDDEKVDADACVYYLTDDRNLAKVLCFSSEVGHRTSASTFR